MKPPNILLLMVDQMTAGTIAALGHPSVHTPHLDRLAARSVSFSNAYCNSPICVPSRASFLTGRLPGNIRVYDNGSELPAAVPTLAHHLRLGGYRTVLSGKMHFVGPDQLHGFDERLTGDISLSGFGLTPDWRLGAYPNEGSSVRRLEAPNVVDWNLQLAFDEEVEAAALGRLRSLAGTGERFFLCASFSHPHDPFRITREYWERYDGVPIPPPAAPATPAAELHPYNRWIQTHHEADRIHLTGDVIAANRRAYLAMVSYADEKVGNLLDELERLGLDDTLVVFTSDHGEMLGEHGMWFKRTFFDPAAKVPLLVSWPGRIEPGEREEVVSLVDLSATVLEAAQVPDAETWIEQGDGDSLLGMLTGGRGAWKDSAVCEYYAEGTLEPMLFLRKGRYKYVHVHSHRPLLFDLESDPLELRDLAGDESYAELCRKLSDELLAGVDSLALKESILRSQRDRLLVAEVLADHKAWAHRPVRDAFELYRGRDRG